MKKKDIIKQGYVFIKTKKQGMIQKMKFDVVKEKITNEKFMYVLKINKILMQTQLQEIADEMDFPIFSNEKKVFPKQKGMINFIEKN